MIGHRIEELDGRTFLRFDQPAVFAQERRESRGVEQADLICVEIIGDVREIVIHTNSPEKGGEKMEWVR